MTTEILTITEVQDQQANKEGARNRAFRDLEGNLTRILSTTVDPNVVVPAAGDAYVVPISATGVFASHVDNIAHYHSGRWWFYPPAYQRPMLSTTGQVVVWNGSSWLPFNGIRSTVNQIEGDLPGSSYDVDLGVAELFDFRLSANSTIDIDPTWAAAQSVGVKKEFRLIIRQPFSGGPYTATFPAGWNWDLGAAPVLSVTAGNFDAFDCTFERLSGSGYIVKAKHYLQDAPVSALPPPPIKWSLVNTGIPEWSLSPDGHTITRNVTGSIWTTATARDVHRKTGGKWYVECQCNAGPVIGAFLAYWGITSYLEGNPAHLTSYPVSAAYHSGGERQGYGATVNGWYRRPIDQTFDTGGLPWNQGAINMLAIDYVSTPGSLLFWWGVNGTWFGGGNPATATSPTRTLTDPGEGMLGAGGGVLPLITIQPLANSFTFIQPVYAVPAGFEIWD